MSKKHYLIDTSVILDDPQNLIHLYENAKNTLYVSDIVLEELDKKKGASEVGYLAREFFRSIVDKQDDWREAESSRDAGAGADLDSDKDLDSRGALDSGDSSMGLDSGAKSATTPNPESAAKPSAKPSANLAASLPTNLTSRAAKKGDFLRVIYYESRDVTIPIIVIYRPHYKTTALDYGLNDAKIAEIASDYRLILLTNDMALKIRSIAKGIKAQSLRRDRVENPSDIDFWHRFLLHKDSDIARLEKSKEFKRLSQWSLIQIDEQDNTDSSLYLTGKKRFGIKVESRFEELLLDEIIKEANPYVAPMNLEQKMLFCLLTHKKNIATIATGSTGSGKTLIALQAGIHLVRHNIVDGIIYLRNTITANDKEAELGFRKGDEEQKLGYFMYPLYSAINFTIDSLQNSNLKNYLEYRGDVNTIHKEDATEHFLKKHHIQVVDIAHARGITIRRKFVIFDEAQNASNATIKLVGTRLGEESRIVFLGDWAQIDHPYLSKFRNGAVSLLQKALQENIIAGIQLRQTIRSNIAQWFGESF